MLTTHQFTIKAVVLQDTCRYKGSAAAMKCNNQYIPKPRKEQEYIHSIWAELSVDVRNSNPCINFLTTLNLESLESLKDSQTPSRQ